MRCSSRAIVLVVLVLLPGCSDRTLPGSGAGTGAGSAGGVGGGGGDPYYGVCGEFPASFDEPRCREDENGCQGVCDLLDSCTFEEFGVCAVLCEEDRDCPAPPDGNARPHCEFGYCTLSCQDGEVCPDGMECVDDEFGPDPCMWRLVNGGCDAGPCSETAPASFPWRGSPRSSTTR